MKKLKIILVTLLAAGSTICMAQEQTKKDSASNKREYQRRTYRKTMKLTAKDSVKVKENTPVQNDKGTFSTTGTIDGRSATGRPGADTAVSYTVKRKKTTIKTVDGNQPAGKPKK